MKRYIYKLWVIVCAVALFSCSDDIMDEINKNVNNPTEMSSQFIITDVMVNTAFSVVGTDLTFYASSYIEHNVGIWNQLYNAEIRTNEPSNSTTYNNSWSSIYNNLYNLKVIREKCSAGGEEEGNVYTLGIAQVLSAYNLAILTDAFGDVPWSEALQPGNIFSPKIDSQEEIYAEIFKLLDEGIANLSSESKFAYLGTQDMYYGGNAASIALWKKLAFGLKARYTMRLSARNAKYADVITFANSSFASAAEQCKMSYNGTTTVSPFYQFLKDRNYFGTSKSFYEKLEVRNDPRLSVLFKPAPDASELVLAPNGSPRQIQNFYGISAISKITAPTYLLSYHEIEFLKAEAYARSGDLTNATASLKKAIIAACGKVNVGITEASATEYFDTEVAPKLTTAEAALAEIMVQKYIAFYEEESFEAYNDYRRLKAMGNANLIELSNPLNSGNFPLRYVYGADDVTTNKNVSSVTGDGSYVFTENVWWAGGTR